MNQICLAKSYPHKYQKGYDTLITLAKQASLGVLLELFVALRKAQGDIERRDRLIQATGLILEHGLRNKKFRLENLGEELLNNLKYNRKTVTTILELATKLPLAWGPGSGYENYASLSSAQLLELIQKLLSQNTLKKNLGPAIETVEHYVRLLRVILTLIMFNHIDRVVHHGKQTLAEKIEWKDFLISSPHLPKIHKTYCTLTTDLFTLNLPLIPFISLNFDLWLISKELIHSTLLQLFVNLLKLAQSN